jgi:glyoxylase-like metal-dependent hydrolase (beta-lactamase superfamily II)
VTVAGTLAEGDTVAGFEVVHLPGHAPGMIGLWRSGDRLALTSDCFYTVDPLSAIYGPPRVPLAAFNQDTSRRAPRSASSPRSARVGVAGPRRAVARGRRGRAGDRSRDDLTRGQARPQTAQRGRRGRRAGAGSFADLGLDLDLPAAGRRRRRRRTRSERELELRTALSPGTRAEYAALLRG